MDSRGVVDYKIVGEGEVKEHLRLGWELWGSPFGVVIEYNERLYQAMVKYEDSEQVN